MSKKETKILEATNGKAAAISKYCKQFLDAKEQLDAAKKLCDDLKDKLMDHFETSGLNPPEEISEEFVNLLKEDRYCYQVGEYEVLYIGKESTSWNKKYLEDVLSKSQLSKAIKKSYSVYPKVTILK